MRILLMVLALIATAACSGSNYYDAPARGEHEDPQWERRRVSNATYTLRHVVTGTCLFVHYKGGVTELPSEACR